MTGVRFCRGKNNEEGVKMKYGVAYYPEQRDKEQMEREVCMLKDAGINVVRMGEFAWCLFEPSQGKYNFGWLDEAVEMFGDVGIKSIICTPTACPPAWMVEKHPDILYVDNRGTRRPFGGRRHYCYSNETYIKYCEKIAEKIAEHYGDNPYVIGFQIDNEPAQELTGRCHCKACLLKFRSWLKNKYGTVENLNRRMGTIFWGQTYDGFEQINMPVNTIETGAEQAIGAFYENPSLRLDYERFCSESQVEFINAQLAAMKRYTEKPVTTNGTGVVTNSINYYDCYGELDRYAFDYYPSLRDGGISSFSYAFARGVKNAPFWVLEFTSGGGQKLGGEGRLAPYPGALEQAVMHAFANGARLLCHFQFRTFEYGAEQLNYAIVGIDGAPGRVYREMKKTANLLTSRGGFLEDSTLSSEVAVCFDYDSYWAQRIKPINHRDYDYMDYCGEIYESLCDIGVNSDVISCKSDFSRYKVIIMPSPFIFDDDCKARIKGYVKNGGVVLATFLTGIKNVFNVGIRQPAPCGMTDLFGVTVSEGEPVFPSGVTKIKLDGCDDVFSNRFWLEVLEPHGAEKIGVYDSDFRKGECAASKMRYGSGEAYYLGTGLESRAMKLLLKKICEAADVERVPFSFKKGIKVVTRMLDGRHVYCVFNFLKEKTRVSLDREYKTLDSGTVCGSISLEPKGYIFLFET